MAKFFVSPICMFLIGGFVVKEGFKETNIV